MIKGVGVDLVQVSRIENILQKYDDRFRQKVFTSEEVSYCEQYSHPAPHYAARFAAKEALLKMLGTGLSQGITWRELAVKHDSRGKPEVQLTGKAKKVAHQNQIVKIHISLSHESDYALAQVIGEGGFGSDSIDSRTDAKYGSGNDRKGISGNLVDGGSG